MLIDFREARLQDFLVKVDLIVVSDDTNILKPVVDIRNDSVTTSNRSLVFLFAIGHLSLP